MKEQVKAVKRKEIDKKREVEKAKLVKKSIKQQEVMKQVKPVELKTEQAKPNLRITDNDIKVLEVIYRFRFLELEQILLVIGAQKKVTGYARMQRLKKLGLVEGRMLLARGQAYCLTAEGMRLIRKEPRILKIGLGSYEHEIKLAQILLAEINAGREVITERELRRTIKGGGHCPDGIIIDGDKWIAIEVELSEKASVRIKQIIDFYIMGRYTEVWYFTDSPRVRELLERNIKQKRADDFIVIKELSSSPF